MKGVGYRSIVYLNYVTFKPIKYQTKTTIESYLEVTICRSVCIMYTYRSPLAYTMSTVKTPRSLNWINYNCEGCDTRICDVSCIEAYIFF